MSREPTLDCACCPLPKYKRACDSDQGPGPGGCPTLTAGDALASAREVYDDPQIRWMAQEASRQEAAGYCDRASIPRPVKSRLEELCEFARRMGFRRLGLAFCGGLVAEAEQLATVLIAQGFEVVSVVCKVGAVAKEELGLVDDEKIRPGRFEAMCNPIAQAELLNRAHTDLNIMMGLCVGHDALFLRHVRGYTTVFAVKDRLLGHNPMAALYTAGSYNRWLLGCVRDT
jgi:uncharacterized metal-binding protein